MSVSAPAARTITRSRSAFADDGPGIPPDKQERIFEAYYTTKEKGTGLGLATVKHNVELYGGTVRVESELGKGRRFILTIPRQNVDETGKNELNATPANGRDYKGWRLRCRATMAGCGLVACSRLARTPRLIRMSVPAATRARR